MEKVQAENAQESAQIKTVADLTIPEFEQIVRKIVQEVIWDLEANLPDPDEGLEFKPEFEADLLEALKIPAEELRGKPLQDIMKEMGIDE